MIDEARIVAWKEWKEWLSRPESAGLSAYMSRSGNVTWRQLVFIPVIGIILPLQFGEVWITSAWPVGLWVFLTVIPSALFSADSFAGERERQTLESLLATPISDRGILLGKIAAGVSVSWLTSLMIPVLGLVTANIAGWEGSFRFYPALTVVAGLVLSLLMTVLVVSLGSITSMRAATVQEAAMTLTFPLMTVPMILSVVAMTLLRSGSADVIKAIFSGDPLTIVAIAAAVLAVLDLALLRIALARFQRRRLISRV